MGVGEHGQLHMHYHGPRGQGDTCRQDFLGCNCAVKAALNP